MPVWVFRKGMVLSVLVLILAVSLSLLMVWPEETLAPTSTRTIRPIIRYVDGYQEGPAVSAAAAVLMDAATGTVLYGKNEHQPRPPASTTKIMTAILALERGNLEEKVTVSARACRVGGSRMWLRPGERRSLWELLQGLMLRSGNDAALAIAEHLCGSVEVFVAMMNERAATLGAWQTHFSNPHGLPSRQKPHYTTAFDLALMTRRGLQIPRFRELVRTRQEAIPDEEKDWVRQLRNTNKLLWSFPGADGVKTGTTREAGQCLAASATRDGWQLIAVVLGSHNRWRDAAMLLEYGFRSFTPVLVAEGGEELVRLPVEKGRKPEVPVGLVEDLLVILRPAESKRLEARYVLPGELKAPVRKGTVLGKISVLVDGQEITSRELVALEEVAGTAWYSR